MTFRSSWLTIFLPLLAGCGAAPSPTAATALLRPAAQESNAALQESNPSGIQRVSHSPALPRLAPEQTYGVWVDDAGSSWLRLEKPRLRIVSINPERRSGRLCNAHYAIAQDGSVYGCIHEIGQISASACQDLSWSNESSLRGLRMTKVALPFHCEMCADGEALRILDFRGPMTRDAGDGWHFGTYRKVALTRPGHAGILPPLGNWERQPDSHDRVVLSILPDQIGVTIVDGKAGKRSRWLGECSAGPDGLLYGMFLTVDHALGREKPEPLMPPPLFCMRLGSSGAPPNVLGLDGLDIDEAMRSRLLGAYRPCR
ncbi:MAG: hypothetical protein FJ271_17030 [Planctomycetes bacterium]|nr:hypothetical protein [Planctomycetota bacterium]